MSDRSRNPRIFIGNLSRHLRERDIDDIFGEFGPIRSIALKTDYGFVEYEDYRDADDAIYEMDGRSVDGQRIRVQEAKGRRRDDERGRRDEREMKCYNCNKEGHLARDCSEEDWSNKCYSCGEAGHIKRDCPTAAPSVPRSRSPGAYRSRTPPRRRSRTPRRRARSPIRSRTPPRRRSRTPPRRRARSPIRSRTPPRRRSRTPPRRRSPPASSAVQGTSPDMNWAAEPQAEATGGWGGAPASTVQGTSPDMNWAADPKAEATSGWGDAPASTAKWPTTSDPASAKEEPPALETAPATE